MFIIFIRLDREYCR